MGIGILDIEQTCLECGRNCINRRSLGNHVARSHPEMGGLQGYVMRFLMTQPNLCVCGCGELTSWHNSHYRFNDYVNGHNEAGFRAKQPEFTPEQIDRRNQSIRRAYAERSEEITKKISESVTKGIAQSDYDFKDLWNRLWADPEFRAKQHKSRVKSWAGGAGEDRKRRVFTPEFIKRCAASRAENNAPTRVSKQELAFVERLKLVLGEENVQHQKWFNFSERTWCADVWLPEHRTIVEFDGTYHHGLDRDRDYTVGQLTHIVNDMNKDLIAIDKKLTLIRISSDVNIDNITSYEDLVGSAYRIIDSGVVKVGSMFSIDETVPLVSRDRLVMAQQAEKSMQEVEDILLPTITELFKCHVRAHGWFYPPVEGNVGSVLASLGNVKPLVDELEMSNAGSTWLKSFVRSYWNVDGGPVQAFNDDVKLDAVLRYRLGLNNSKLYRYDVDGQEVTAHETFDINLRNVRTGFIVQRNKVSWFRPAWATAVYKRFLDGISDPVVWDPSIGFSARLLGFAGAVKSGTYIGTDPAKMMHDDAVNLAYVLNRHNQSLKFDVRAQGSEHAQLGDSSVDFVFTSPPYFDCERYVDEPGQCWRDHPTIDSWTTNYLEPTLANVARALKPNRNAVINVNQQLSSTVLSVADRVGLEHVDTLRLPVKHDHFARAKGHGAGNKFEPLLVFKRTS